MNRWACSVPVISKVPYKTGKQSCELVVLRGPSYKFATNSFANLRALQFTEVAFSSKSWAETFFSAHYTSSIHAADHRTIVNLVRYALTRPRDGSNIHLQKMNAIHSQYTVLALQYSRPVQQLDLLVLSCILSNRNRVHACHL